MQSDIAQMLQMMDRPAFLVQDGIITAANQAALGRMIQVGQPIAPLLSIGKTEYAGFTEGWMYLTVCPGGTDAVACVRRLEQCDLFMLEPEQAEETYQGLALAAQKLRVPLTGIFTMADRLFPSLQLAEGSPEAEQAAKINRNLHQMLRIILNMSDAAHYSSGTPIMETRDVNAVLAELFEQAAPLCELSGIRLEYSGLSRPVYSLINSDQLERCVYNILSNALQHTPAGGSVHASLTRSGNTLYLTVTDTGTGLNSQKMGNLYTRFLREPSIQDPEQGVGLGMTLIRACANAHGGSLLIAPAKSGGVKVTVSLPIRLGITQLSSPRPHIDYAGERDHRLIEFSDSLPHSLYHPKDH